MTVLLLLLEKKLISLSFKVKRTKIRILQKQAVYGSINRGNKYSCKQQLTHKG